MSITTLKRKSDAKRNISGKLGGFSLNDSRRVDSQSGKTKTQTSMRGTGYVGHGGTYGAFPINPVLSQYSNTYDPFNVPRPSVKTNNAMLRQRLRDCDPIVKNKPSIDASEYIKLLKQKTEKNDCSEKASGKCIIGEKTGNYVKTPMLSYQEYYATKFLNNQCVLLPEDQSDKKIKNTIRKAIHCDCKCTNC
jgi:hypothetical protein